MALQVQILLARAVVGSARRGPERAEVGLRAALRLSHDRAPPIARIKATAALAGLTGHASVKPT